MTHIHLKNRRVSSGSAQIFLKSSALMNQLFGDIKREWRKWAQSIKTSLIKSATYKINFLLTLFVPIFIYFFIKYNLWTAIYHFNGAELIKGYTLKKMIQYQFWILILDLFVKSQFFSLNLSEEIRLGRISSFLLYPFSFIKYQSSLFISDKIIQLFAGTAVLCAALFLSWVDPAEPGILIRAFVLIFMVSGFWFLTQVGIGFLAFWLEETWSINVSIRFLTAFLSGSLLPLDLYPELFKNILVWTPFPYLIYFPVKMLMGETVPFGFVCGVLGGWLIVLAIFNSLLWKKGLKLYTGSGI